MDHDEEHLVMHGAARLGALQLLGVEEFVQSQIAPVVEVRFHRGDGTRRGAHASMGSGPVVLPMNSMIIGQKRPGLSIHE